jgi:hypothetical protein
MSPQVTAPSQPVSRDAVQSLRAVWVLHHSLEVTISATVSLWNAARSVNGSTPMSRSGISGLDLHVRTIRRAREEITRKEGTTEQEAQEVTQSHDGMDSRN